VASKTDGRGEWLPWTLLNVESCWRTREASSTPSVGAGVGRRTLFSRHKRTETRLLIVATVDGHPAGTSGIGIGMPVERSEVVIDQDLFDGDASTTRESESRLLAVLALGITCVAVYLVGRVAWPTLRDDLPDDSEEAYVAERQLQAGLALTFAAVALVALAALADWWPAK
jgi:hypothetical protein